MQREKKDDNVWMVKQWDVGRWRRVEENKAEDKIKAWSRGQRRQSEAKQHGRMESEQWAGMHSEWVLHHVLHVLLCNQCTRSHGSAEFKKKNKQKKQLLGGRDTVIPAGTCLPVSWWKTSKMISHFTGGQAADDEPLNEEIKWLNVEIFLQFLASRS